MKRRYFLPHNIFKEEQAVCAHNSPAERTLSYICKGAVKTAAVFIVILIFSQGFITDKCFAYWIWTPEIGKWINPKYAVKATPQEQFEWAFKLYGEKEYSKAAAEFDKLVFNYPASAYAPKSLYYRGMCLEETGYYYEACRSYDKVLREYPTFENIDEIIEKEFKIGQAFLGGRKRKTLGMKIFPALDSAVEIFTSIAENAPFSKYGPESQFNVGVALKKDRKYILAKEAFDKVILNYPESSVVEKARYESADCSFRASGESAYEQNTTRRAIEEFDEFVSGEVQDKELLQQASSQLLALEEKDAGHLYEIAGFYERMKKYEAAVIYYREIVDKYPRASFSGKAKDRIEKLETKMRK